jgi:hypothetical protein
MLKDFGFCERIFFWRLVYFCMVKYLNCHNSSFALRYLFFTVNGKATNVTYPLLSMCHLVRMYREYTSSLHAIPGWSPPCQKNPLVRCHWNAFRKLVQIRKKGELTTFHIPEEDVYSYVQFQSPPLPKSPLLGATIMHSEFSSNLKGELREVQVSFGLFIPKKFNVLRRFN